MTRFFLFFLCLALVGCGLQLPQFGQADPAEIPSAEAAVVAVPDAETPRPDARPGAEEGMASGVLGSTIATLGDATVTGLWLETPLVAAPVPGRVTTDGVSVDVQLVPSGGLEGSGSRLSLAAMQALGLPLTAIAEVTVEAL